MGNHTPRSFLRGQLKENAVMVFIHVPKAGGESIVENMIKIIPTITHFTHRKHKQHAWEMGKDYIDHYVSTAPSDLSPESSKPVFLEIHVSSPPFMDIIDRLQSWRRNATANGVELFVFTIVREPVSLQLSLFNYNFIKNGKYVGLNSSAINNALRDQAYENVQCSFLVHRWNPWRRWSPEKKDCDLLFDAMKDQIDFAGTTENHQDITEMLKFLLDLPRNFTFELTNSARTNNKASIKYEEMSSETIELYKNVTLLDYELHQNVQAEWSVSYG
jgi:hypothetical protein